jgi:hypothetical protein
MALVQKIMKGSVGIMAQRPCFLQSLKTSPALFFKTMEIHHSGTSCKPQNNGGINKTYKYTGLLYKVLNA